MRKCGLAALLYLTAGFSMGLYTPQVRAQEEAGEDLVAVADFNDFGELELEELLNVKVTSVSKHEETLAETPATVTVLTRDDFLLHGWLSVAEALASVPGIYVSWGRDTYYPGVRGVSIPRDSGTRILVLLDGHTMNNPWSASGKIDELLTLPVEAIERVEVIRGPASSMYGSNAFLAVVNIISRKGDEKDDQMHLAGSLGWNSLGRNRAAVAGHYRFPCGFTVGLYAAAKSGDGPTVQFDDMTRPRLSSPKPTPSGGRTSGTDFERGYNAGAHIGWNGFNLRLSWSDRLKGLPTARGDSIFDDDYNSVRDTHGFAELSYQHSLGDHVVMGRAYYDIFRDREYLHRDPTDWVNDRWFSDDPHTISEGNDDTFGGEIRGTFHLHETDTLTVGVEIQTHEVTQPTYELDPQSGDPIPESRFGGLREVDGSIKPTTYWNLGVYAQNDWRPLDNLALVAGLRFDHNSLFFEQEETKGYIKGLSPRAAVVYSPIEDTTVKLMYGEAFRNPSVFEAFYDDGASVCGNSEVSPERLRTVELSGIWEFAKGWSVGMSVFYTRMDGLLEKQTIDPCYEGSGPRLQFVNHGELTIFGGEAEFSMHLKSGLGLFANLGLWLAEHSDFGQATQPPNSPPIIAGGGAFMPLWKDKLLLSARVRYVSERLNWTLDEERPENGYLRVDATLTLRRVLAGLFASVTLTNALDLDYRDPVTSRETIPTAVPQDGIAVCVRVGHEW